MPELDDLTKRTQELEDSDRRLKTALSDLKRSYDITLGVLGEALDYRDRETEGHSKRVTGHTMAIASRMGFPREQIEIIARGAFLHDIGKMAVPDSILYKPGALAPDETAVMRQHCLLGYTLVRKIPLLAETADIVYSHHERFDGSGYPRGLRGEQIPLGARIVAVANTLDSITSDLRYRAAQTLDAAREEIKKWSGRQFDPEVVKVFLEMPNKVWEDLGKRIDGEIVCVPNGGSFILGDRTRIQ